VRFRLVAVPLLCLLFWFVVWFFVSDTVCIAFVNVLYFCVSLV
jgi:hypothetical protein